MRGQIVEARIASPDVLHVEIEDLAGEPWHLASQRGEWSPSDPSRLVGCSVDDAYVDPAAGELRCLLSNGSMLAAGPTPREAEGDPPNWKLIAPGGLSFEFGPGARWQIATIDARPVPR